MNINIVIDAPVLAWIEAIGTAGAFLIAGVAYAAEIRRRRHAEKFGQAQAVTAWLAPSPPGVPGDVIFVKNSSDRMVTDVVLYPHDDLTGSLQKVGDVAPGETVKDSSMIVRRSGTAIMRTTAATISFTDAQGNLWIRNSDGQLTRALGVRVQSRLGQWFTVKRHNFRVRRQMKKRVRTGTRSTKSD